MAEILSDRSSQFSDLRDRRNLKFSNSAITFERIEIFWLLDQILKALIEADRMVPLLRVYDVDFMDFENFNEKKTYRKKRTLVRFFFVSLNFAPNFGAVSPPPIPMRFTWFFYM